MALSFVLSYTEHLGTSFKTTDSDLPFAHVPDSNTLILGVTENQLLPRMKQTARNVVVVTAACVNLPRLRFCNV